MHYRELPFFSEFISMAGGFRKKKINISLSAPGQILAL
jgi:hypothetical protein